VGVTQPACEFVSLAFDSAEIMVIIWLPIEPLPITKHTVWNDEVSKPNEKYDCDENFQPSVFHQRFLRSYLKRKGKANTPSAASVDTIQPLPHLFG
jgi:hypothetical protein